MINVELFLKEQGYSDPVPDPIYRPEATIWYKRVSGTVKHQVEVKQWKSLNPNKFEFSYEVEMTYETKHGVWANTKFYGLSEEDLLKLLPQLELRLKHSLVFMGANPVHYRYDGQD